ncbi:MAG: hypothetical protein L0216_16785 [Planctomycetales bacterium]|nr:hypothetical protein [Planctomycetales bacterium]
MPEKPDRKTEGHRIHVFINLMKGCGCAFDSGEIPTFLKRGPLEFWEGTFQYAPGGVAIKGKVTLDHDFITLRSEAPMPREEVRRHREAIHLLLTDNGVHYSLEPDPRDAQSVVLVLGCHLYDYRPKLEMVRILLDNLSHAARELSHARATQFRNYKPQMP